MGTNLPEEFKYDFFVKNRYLMPKHSFNGIEYEAMCNNGYIKLYTIPGKIYWLVQNTFDHLTPDWKFHVSVKDKDLERAWNLVAEIFLTKNCRSSMKVKYKKENKITVRGREITIYISIWDDKYDKSDIGEEFKFNRDIQQNEDFWYDLFDSIEKSLKDNNITSNGLAKGDYALGNYVSIRNEAYIIDQYSDKEIYPPDWAGWNAAKQQLPFELNKFRRVKEVSKKNMILNLGIVTLIILVVSLIIYK
jgi:hypothetical protein